MHIVPGLRVGIIHNDKSQQYELHVTYIIIMSAAY